MPASIEFHSVTPRPVDDHTRLHLIRKELEAMSIRQERLHMMDSDPYFADCIDEVVERIDVLPHQALDLQESRHQLPLVLDFFDGLAHLGRVYARLP